MVEYIFGKYLVECGKISKEQMNHVLQGMDSARAKLGLLAVAEDAMTVEQAEEVNRLQALMDKKFGDIAVEKGYLTEEQVGELLEKQGDIWLTFIQALVDEGLVSLAELELLADDFKREYGYDDKQLEDLKSDETDKIIPLLLPEEADKYKELIGTVVRTMVRLIDRRIYVGQAAMLDEFPEEDMVSQSLVGEIGFTDCFVERDGALLQVSSIFGQEEFSMLNMDALDAAGELLNCVNGLYASTKSEEGHFLELMPPEYCLNVSQSNAGRQLKNICQIPIFIGNKGLYFAVGE